MMFNKYLVIMGEDCDVHDPDRLAALLRRAEFPRDLIVSEEFTTYSTMRPRRPGSAVNWRST